MPYSLALVSTVAVLPPISARAQAPALLWMGEPDAEFVGALRAEMAVRRIAVRIAPAPQGTHRMERAVAAVRALAIEGAAVAFWIERRDDAAERALCAVAHDAEQLHYAPLPVEPDADPISIAVVAAALWDEARGPEEPAPIAARVRAPVPIAPTAVRVEAPAPELVAARVRAPAAQARPTPPWFFLDAGVATNVAMVGLELGFGIRLWGPLALGAKVRSFLTTGGLNFAGSATAVLWWIEPLDDFSLDAGLEGGATMEIASTGSERTPDIVHEYASVGWIAGALVGVSFRANDTTRLAARLAGGATGGPWGGGPLPMAVLSFNVVAGL